MNYMDYGVKIIKRHITLRIVGCGYRLSLYALRQLCLWHKQRVCNCGMQLLALYKCYICLCLCMYMYVSS